MNGKLVLMPPQLLADDPPSPDILRLECRCPQHGNRLGSSTVELACYTAAGRIFLHCRGGRNDSDRLFHVYGTVLAFCPACGAGHVLDSATIRQEHAR